MTAEAATILEPISKEIDIIENEGYRKLCLLYKGELLPDEITSTGDDPLQNATLGYGVANWYLVTGKPALAETTWRQILKGSQWAAFGYIAAEADLNEILAQCPLVKHKPNVECGCEAIFNCIKLGIGKPFFLQCHMING